MEKQGSSSGKVTPKWIRDQLNKIKKTYSSANTPSDPPISINSIPSKSIKFNHSLDLKEDSFDLPLSKESSSFMMDVSSHRGYPPSTYPISRDIPVEEETVIQEEKTIEEEQGEVDKEEKEPEEKPEEETGKEKSNQQEELKEEEESDSSPSNKGKRLHTDSDDELVIEKEGMSVYGMYDIVLTKKEKSSKQTSKKKRSVKEEEETIVEIGDTQGIEFIDGLEYITNIINDHVIPTV